MRFCKKSSYSIFIVVLTFVLFDSAIAQQKEPGYGSIVDSTYSNYENQDAMGGPKTVGAQIMIDNQKKESYFRIPIRVFKPYFDWKGAFQQKTGIQFSLNYTSVFMTSSKVIDDEINEKNASSGILDFQMGWTFINRNEEKNKGTLFLKINSRHSYSNSTAPMFHGIGESGYYGLPATGFRDYTIRVLELNWQQNLIDDKLTLIAGKVDPTNYFNFHGLLVPWQGFLGYGSSVSGTVNWPDMGFGVLAGYKITDRFYAMGGLTDVRGDEYKDGSFLYFGENFFKGNFFKVLEAGFVPTMGERYFKKISITYWNSDAYTASNGAKIPQGEGIAFSSHWFFNNKWAPFLRFAFSNGNGENTFYKRDFQIGNGIIFRSHDLLGTSFGWAETNIPEAKDQMTIEVFYRIQLTEHLAFTPDFQWIFNPTLNPAVNNLQYFGLRGRITL